MLIPRNLKGGIRSLFDPCVKAMGQWPFWQSCMEVSYRTTGFAFIRHNLCTVSLLRVLPKCVRDLSLFEKGNTCLTKLRGGLSYEQIQRLLLTWWQNCHHNRFLLSISLVNSQVKFTFTGKVWCTYFLNMFLYCIPKVFSNSLSQHHY